MAMIPTWWQYITKTTSPSVMRELARRVDATGQSRNDRNIVIDKWKEMELERIVNQLPLPEQRRKYTPNRLPRPRWE